MSKTKIAIACQGGGQTAFTAGVLAEVFDQGIRRRCGFSRSCTNPLERVSRAAVVGRAGVSPN